MGINPRDLPQNYQRQLGLEFTQPNLDLEKVEQGNFAVECNMRGWRYVWHRTDKRSTANRGCPDFIVAAKGQTFWIEFKRGGEELSPDQSVFAKELAANGIEMHVVTSAAAALNLIEPQK